MNRPAGTASERTGLRGLNLEVVAIIAGVVVMTHAAGMVTVPLLPRYVSELGGSVLAVGLALSSYAAARLFTNIPAGMLSERIGRRPVIIVGALGAGVFASLSGSAATVRPGTQDGSTSKGWCRGRLPPWAEPSREAGTCRSRRGGW